MFLLSKMSKYLICWLFLFLRFVNALESGEADNKLADAENVSTSLHSKEEDEENKETEENEDEGDDDDSDNSEEESCILNVNKDLPVKNEPLILSVNDMNITEIVLPEAENMIGVIKFKEGEEVIVACPGVKNYVEETKDEFNKILCKEGTVFSLKGEIVKFQNLACHSKPEATIRTTSRACARGKGAIVEIGFQISGWNELIEACHNFAQSSTFYTLHTLHGSRLGGKVHVSAGRTSFSRGDGELFRGINPSDAYTQKHQHTALEESLGKERTEEIINVKSGSYLVRGFLAPDADFLLSPHQLLAYTYVNVAPQWYTINSGSWLKLQEYIRQYASTEGADFEVATGTTGVLRLLGNEGPRQLWLLRNKIPVPEFFWKIIRNIEDDSCIVFVVSNNPFAKQKPRRLCRDICSANHWPLYQRDYSQGYVYCCDYARIKRILKDIPSLQCNLTMSGQLT